MASESELNEYFNHAAKAVATAYHHAMRGGEIQAFVRQGFNELGAALKAFPDSIQVDESGQVFNPIFHDMVHDRKSHEEELGRAPQAADKPMTAGQIAGEPEEHRGGVHGQQQEQGTVQGNIYGYSREGEQGRVEPAPAKPGVDGLEKGVHGRDNAAPEPVPSAGQIAEDKGLEGAQGQGMQVAQVPPTPGPWPVPGGFVERENLRDKAREEGNADNDGYERTRERSLPDEQRGR